MIFKMFYSFSQQLVGPLPCGRNVAFAGQIWPKGLYPLLPCFLPIGCTVNVLNMSELEMASDGAFVEQKSGRKFLPWQGLNHTGVDLSKIFGGGKPKYWGRRW